MERGLGGKENLDDDGGGHDDDEQEKKKVDADEDKVADEAREAVFDEDNKEETEE